MREKNRSKKRILSLALAAVLCVTSLLTGGSLTAQAAAEIETANQAAFKNPVDNAGTTTYQTIYFGQRDVSGTKTPIQWRVLESDNGELFLLSEEIQATRAFGHDWAYGGTDIRHWLNSLTGTLGNNTPVDYTSTGFLSNFSGAELAAIAPQNAHGSGNMAIETLTANNNGDKVFLLSGAEAGNSQYFPNGNTDRKTGSNWWLRSGGNDSNLAAIVWGYGLVYAYGDLVNDNDGVRPALKINLSSVIFSSSAAGGKPTGVGANLEAAQQPTAEIKLTVLDTRVGNLNLVIDPADTAPKTAVQGETIAIPYTGAVADSGVSKFVSCVIEDSSGIKYYAKLATAANDTATIEIPATMPVGSYTIKMFNEQDNGVNNTDFASDPIAVPLAVQYAPVSIASHPADTTITEGNNTGFSVIAAGSASITYQWEESSDGGSSWNPIAGETSATLTLDSVPIASNGKQYHCVVNNPVNMPVTSNSATLTVNVTPTTPTVTPTSLSMQEGATGSFSVTMGTGTDRATSVAIASDDITIATVDTSSLTANDNATVIGVAAGTANINLTWTDGSKDGTTDTVAVTVTALPPNSYAVTFDPSSGTVVSGSLNQTITHGSSAVAPVLTRDGYTFDGWDKDFSNITTNITVTAQWKQIPPAGISHTITLGTSGDGTVSGDGTYAENSTATVTATANAGNSFVSWTENGTVVAGAGASYSFAVTADRTLVANFKADDAPEPPVIIYPSGSGHSSSSGGSSTPDVVRVSGRAFTKAEATKLFAAALAAKPEGATTLSIKARNYTSADKAVLAELAALAQKNGVTLTVHFDTVVGKAVTYRMSVNPDLINTNLDLTAKIVGGKITLPRFNPAVEVAVKMPEGITIETLKITQNGKDITATAKPWLDKNGYLHFSTTGGELVLGK